MHDDGYFDEPVASRYDESSAEMFDPAIVDPAVDFLAELAGDGRALELGIGTGRIALPLAERGVQVHGIDLSTAMVSRLRDKPGGKDIEVTVGDFATARAGGPAELVVLDGEDLAVEPVARIHLPQRVPDGFHGNWVPDASVPPG